MAVNRILIVDDQQIFRLLLREILSDVPDIQVVGEVSGGQEAIDMAEDLVPDVVLMDIELNSRVNGIEAGKAIKRRRPRTGIVLFSTHKSGEFIVNAPGWSYLLKNNLSNIETLINAINGAAWGLQIVDPEVVEAIQSGNIDPVEEVDESISSLSQTIGELGHSNQASSEDQATRSYEDNVRMRGMSYSVSANPTDYMTSEQRDKVITFTLEGYNDEYIASFFQVNVTLIQDWRSMISDDMGMPRTNGADLRYRFIEAFLKSSARSTNAEDAGSEDAHNSAPLIDLSQTPEEGKAVLKLMSQGWDNANIAAKLNISERLVQEYLNVFYSILGIKANPEIDTRLLLARAYMERFTNREETPS